jgi:hypothetical protein
MGASTWLRPWKALITVCNEIGPSVQCRRHNVCLGDVLSEDRITGAARKTGTLRERLPKSHG